MKCHSPITIGGSPVSMYIYVEDVDELFNNAVSAGAKVLDPVKDQFWGDRHGRVEDPFGHHWSIATHKKDLSEEEIEKSGRCSFFSNVIKNFYFVYFPIVSVFRIH